MGGLFKRVTLQVAQSGVFEKFVAFLERSDGSSLNHLRVLTYHRVDDYENRPWLDPGMISATPEVFEEQIRYLAAQYQVVSVSDVIAALESGSNRSLPPRAVLVTFDDAYCDFEEHAWPILKHYKTPVTLFVPTAYPDNPERVFWWDRLYNAVQNTARMDNLETPVGSMFLGNSHRYQVHRALLDHVKSLAHADAMVLVDRLCSDLGVHSTANHVLDWDSLRRLAREGVTLGAHTRTHPLMTRVSLDDALKEVVGSFRDLERETGPTLPVFAYPGGSFSNAIISSLATEGFSLAFTTIRGVNDLKRSNPLALQRINVGARTTLPILRAQLLSWATHLGKFQGILNE